MQTLLLGFLIGMVAGLRAMTAPTAISWAAYLGHLNLSGSLLTFFAAAPARWVLTVLAFGELVTDKLPSTPSRKVPMQFGTRIVTGAFSGAAVGASSDATAMGLVAGVIGAVAGTLGGSAARARMAAALGSDRPAALIEDAIALGTAVLIVTAL